MSDFGDFITTGDHTRGCAGREYACTCGYDDAKDAEILRLRAELAALREPAGDLVEVAAAIMAQAHPGMPWDRIAGAVLAAVLPRVRAEEWRTMESAPSNVEVLLFCPDQGCESNRARIELGYASHGWINEVANNMSYHAWATHWRPLPPLPDAAP